jgi:MFS family permease
VLPLMARYTFDAGPGTYGALAGAMGAGALLGAVANAGRRSPSVVGLAALSLVFGTAMVALAAAPTLALALAALVLVGAASAAFAATTNSLLQLGAAPAIRGRVMALWSVVYLGSTPIGGPLVGWVSEHGGARAGVVVGALATLATGIALLRSGAREARPAELAGRPYEPAVQEQKAA